MNSHMEMAAGSARRVGHRWRYLLALAVALALGFGVAMPVFADDKGGIQPR